MKKRGGSCSSSGAGDLKMGGRLEEKAQLVALSSFHEFSVPGP